MPEWEVRVLSSPGWPKEPLNDCKCWEFAVCLLGRNKVCLSASWQAEPSEVPNVHRAEVEPWIGTGGPALVFLIDLLGNLGLFGGWESQWVVCMDSSLYDLRCCCIFCPSVKVSVQEWSTHTVSSKAVGLEEVSSRGDAFKKEELQNLEPVRHFTWFCASWCGLTSCEEGNQRWAACQVWPTCTLGSAGRMK